MALSGHILVVDDEPAICTNCLKALTKVGHEVACAYNGKDALTLMDQTAFDVVVTDLKMSRLGGMEVLRQVKQNSPDTMVIIITGFSTVSSAVEVMKMGAFDYLPKPFTPDELRTVVNQALQAREVLLQNRQLALGIPVRAKPTHRLVGDSPKIRKVIDMIAKVAPTDATVLIYGESGTGKELVARAIHANSKRRDKVFFAVDCATLTGNLLETELFGHAKGAFTSADQDKEGIFQRADGGTVFLDEISNIDLQVQGKLLRFLESREFLPLGRTTPRKVDLRLVFATNQNLEALVDQGRFRHDFYYRIYVYPIFLPPLRERSEDILPIAYHFITYFSKQLDKAVSGLTPEAVQQLMAHDWPGNARQLRNVIERAMIQCESDKIRAEDLPMGGSDRDLATLIGQTPQTNEELKEIKKTIRRQAVAQVEKNFILQALINAEWNVSQAARTTGLKRTNFQGLMRKYGIKRPAATRRNNNQDLPDSTDG
jgi:DNA-binding NtrC family response regulator